MPSSQNSSQTQQEDLKRSDSDSFLPSSPLRGKGPPSSTTEENPRRLVKFSDEKEGPWVPHEMSSGERDQVLAISPEQIRSFTAKQLQDLTPAQVAALSFEQVKALASHGSTASLREFNLDQLEALKKQFGRLNVLSPREQLEALSVEQYEGLKKNTRKLLPRLIRNYYGHREGKNISARRWSRKEVAEMKPEDIQQDQLTEIEMRELFLQIDHFSLELISAIPLTDMKHFWALPFLSKQQISVLNEEQFKHLSSEQLNLLSEDQILSLTPHQKEILQNSPNKVKNLSRAFTQALFPEITREYIEGLDEKAIQELGNHNRKFSNLEMKAIINQCSLLSQVQIQAIQPEKMQLFSRTDLASLRKEQIPDLLPQQIEKIDSDIFSAFTEEQIPYFTKNQIQSFTIDQFKKLISCLELIQAITPEQMTEFLPRVISKLGATQYFLNLLSEENISALTEEQLRELTSEQIQALTPEHIRALEPKQLNFLLTDQIQTLTPIQLETIDQNKDQVKNLSQPFIEALFPGITSKFIKNLNEETIRDLGNDENKLGNLKIKAVISRCNLLSKDQIQAIPPYQMRFFSQADLASFRDEQIPNMLPQQIIEIDLDVLAHLTKDKFFSLTEDQLKELFKIKLHYKTLASLFRKIRSDE